MVDHGSGNPPLLAPSILAADHAALADGLQLVCKQKLRWLHLDIMDGHFVPNFSFGPQTVADLRHRAPGLFFDTHLMLDNPHEHVEAFAKAGSDLISIHVEPEFPVAPTLRHIRELGCRCGIVLNPSTPADAARPYLREVQLVLVMTVWPGFGGQSFIHDTLPKMHQLHQWRLQETLPFRLEVDGGIDLKTAPLCRSHGVDTFVAGTAFFKATDPAAFARSIVA